MNFSALRQRISSRCRRDLSRLFGRRMVLLRWKRPVVSFTFDDFPKSALVRGGATLRQFGAVGTYYAAFGLMDKDTPVGRIFSAADIHFLLSEGHELGCHTFAHCHAWNTKPSIFEESILENRRALQQVAPGAVFKTHSYPKSLPRPSIKRRAGRRFAACRGGRQIFNLGATDLNALSAFFLEQSRDNPGFVQEMIARNRDASGWLIFATHDVCDQPTPFGCTPDFLENVVRCAANSGARILPVGQALDLILK
jgi:peptidoglycan/xylan/chitin deacetylase (PgdA/CDA1 family)